MATAYGSLNIPPLQPGERISSWEKFFRSAVAHGQKLVIGLCPITSVVDQGEGNRQGHRRRSREIRCHLRGPDQVLRSPTDPQQALLTQCHTEWRQESQWMTILRTKFRSSGPSTNSMPCPNKPVGPAAQNQLKDWITTLDEITKPIERDFIRTVRKVLTEKIFHLIVETGLESSTEVRSGECVKRTTPGMGMLSSRSSDSRVPE